MLFKYVGQMPDSISYKDQDIIFNPDTEIELTEELQGFPYVARMIQNGILKAVSKPAEKAAAPSQEATTQTAPQPTASEPATQTKEIE